MKSIILLIQIFALLSCLNGSDSRDGKSSEIQLLYKECGLKDILSFNVFDLAVTGLRKINGIQNSKIITIIDFSKPSTSERFFVIDLENKKLLYSTLVAHGKNSGENYAKSFSNESESLKSCLGFFITNETYNGDNGYSLMLDGLEPGINDNARNRSIVIHGAAYVSEAFIKENGRLGRSWGCPALPESISKEIIDLISKGSCLFIYGVDPDYLGKSKIINTSKGN
jgi:hypothetical protein